MKQEDTIEEAINQNWLKTDTGVRIRRTKDSKAVSIPEFHMSQKLSRKVEEEKKKTCHIYRGESCRSVWNEKLGYGKSNKNVQNLRKINQKHDE